MLSMSERLAEYGWKHHRVVGYACQIYNNKPITGLVESVKAWTTKGYGFIEFEISNSKMTILTVFRQPLNEGSCCAGWLNYSWLAHTWLANWVILSQRSKSPAWIMYRTAQYRAVQCAALRYSAVQHSKAQFCTVQYSDSDSDNDSDSDSDSDTISRQCNYDIT